MRSLAASLLLCLTLLIGASPAGAAESDAGAIASFLSIGFANAPTNFSAIRGDLVVAGEYQATNWPDRTHFLSCRTWHIDAFAPFAPETYQYSCNSTLRADTSDALFKMAEAAVQANLPSGYTSPGVTPRADGSPYEIWKRTGSADVKLWTFKKDGLVYYELAVVVPVIP